MLRIFRTLALVSGIAGSLTVAAYAQTFEKKVYNYGNWTKGRFSEVVTVTGPGKLIFLAGVGSEEEKDGAILHKGDAYVQCKYAFEKIKKVLALHGAKLSDVVKITTYVTDIRAREDYGKCRTEEFKDQTLPAHTFLNINQLAWPGMLIEIDVTAAVPQ